MVSILKKEYLLLLNTGATGQKADKGLCRPLDNLMALAKCSAQLR